MKPYSYLLLLAVLSVLGSCNKENGEDLNAPAALEARIAGVSLITRGGAADATEISNLGIYAVNATAGESTYGNAPAGKQCTYKLKNGVASPSVEAQTLWLNLEKATIFSFHPATTSTVITVGGNATAPNPTITIPASAITPQKTAITGSGQTDFNYAVADNDYMYGVKYDDSQSDGHEYLTIQPVADNGRAAGSAGSKVSIGLKHVFAQIKLEIKKGDYSGTAAISSVTYTRNMKTLASNGTTTMSLKDGTLANLANAANITYSYAFSTYPVAGTGESGSPAVTITNYVVPNNKANSTVTIIVDGKTMTMPHTSEVDWKAGSIYTYTIRIDGTGLQLDGIRVVNWNDNQQEGVTI